MKILLSLAFSLLLFPTLSSAQNFSNPQSLLGSVTSGRVAYPDLNGNLQFTTQRLNDGTSNALRPHRQLLQNDQTVSMAEAYPLFPNPSVFFSQVGTPLDITNDLDGNRVVTWFAGNNQFLAMTWQSANGTWGPNVVATGTNPSSIAYRNGLVIHLSVSTGSGIVSVKEWDVAPNGQLTERPTIPNLFNGGTSGCGATVAIEADNSAIAVFKRGLEVRSARRTPEGVWSVDSQVIDSVPLGVQSLSCLYAESSPGGRLLAAWWKEGVGDALSKDWGGEIRALLKEPGANLPSTTLSFFSAPVDLSGASTRRDYGISVAMGLDGTAGLIAFAEKCVANGFGKLFSTLGVLRLAGPNQDFYAVDNIALSATESSANQIFSRARLHVPTYAFAVENKRAIIGTSIYAYPNVGTELEPTCGPSKTVSATVARAGKVTLVDLNANSIQVLDLGSSTQAPGQPIINGSLGYKDFVDAAVDSGGNYALVRSDVFSATDYLLTGNWQSGTGQNQQPTPQPTADNDLCPNDQLKLSPGICGCGIQDIDSNKDSIIDCGNPKTFSKNIKPAIASAKRSGKGKASLVMEKLKGSGLSYEVTITGPKRFKRVIIAKGNKVTISKLPTGKLSFRIKIIQKVGRKKPVSSKLSSVSNVTI